MIGCTEGIIKDFILPGEDIKCCRCGNVLLPFKSFKFKDCVFEEEGFTANIICPICNDIAFVLHCRG